MDTNAAKDRATDAAKDEAKDMAASVIAERLPELVALSHSVHSTPELCFNETRSAHAVAEALRAGGLAVTEGVYDIPTAFESRSGQGELVVAVCAEYDALPEVGHACGHNIIAASAVGAGLALAAVADDIGLQVRVLGTPAEEGGGGKILMLDRGAFLDVHAAMMIHPWPVERLTGSCLAVAHFDVFFGGKEAHASAAPWEGVNALDAMTISQVALGLLRQQLPPGDQVHGIITRGGGAANVIPAEVSGRFMARSRTIDGLAALEKRVRGLLRGRRIGQRQHRALREALTGLLAHGGRSGAGSGLPGQRRVARPELRRRRCRRPAPYVLDGHGERVAGGTHHPPAHGDRDAWRGEPPARVHRGVHHPFGRRRGARWCSGTGLDGD